MANPDQLKQGEIVRGAVLPEPVQIILAQPMGDGIKLIGKGMRTSLVHDVLLSAAQVAALQVTPAREPFDGDAARFRLGVEAMRLGLAYEYDPYFTLSIARVDPLPHQLEAVYDYLLKQPRIRFLLADDPGAGKTIMAGLLIKELKIRGLIKRVLIVTPANLTFQWQRELRDKFREQFEVIRGEVLRANYGFNPWQDRNQVITSIAWVSRIEDARDSLLRSHWDLIVVDEAHKMSADDDSHKSLAYELGERLSELTDHLLLMTATPHKGNPEHFCMFLRLLDKDVYGDITSLEEAVRKRDAPMYLRRSKEALVSFPSPDTGEVKSLFTRRIVKSAEFELNSDELEFYETLTSYVEDQSIKAARDDSARGRALGFTMAMLQRRFASSLCAVRRSLERMRDRRQKILDDPVAYRQALIAKQAPENYDDLSDDEQQQILEELEGVVASVDMIALRDEIVQLNRLIRLALELEQREVESKLTKLRRSLQEQGVFSDPTMKLLLFTEHKDTLDFLVAKLRDWRLSVTQIHGGMKIGDANSPGTRLYAENEFKTSSQIMVATEAAGEGINLQFCWFMINYDIPWNPTRLEQRMGRIHRYGQLKDCLVFNFVSTNTREGRVMQKLFERVAAIERDLDPQRTGKVFNVLGEVMPANELERMLRDMYARNLTDAAIRDRIVTQVDPRRFRQITESTLEGLAKRELNLSAIVGKSVEAKERRLVPEVIEDFFAQAAPIVDLPAKPDSAARAKHASGEARRTVYRVGKLPRPLIEMGERLEPQFGKLAAEYKRIAFDQQLLVGDPTLEWVTPGHPLFESVRAEILEQTARDLQHGSVFFDLHRDQPARLDVYSASVRDGLGHKLHRRLFIVETALDGTIEIRRPTLLLDLIAAPTPVSTPEETSLPSKDAIEYELIERALKPFLEEIHRERSKETATISAHVEISLNALIDRQQNRLAQLWQEKEGGDGNPLLAANLAQVEVRLDELNARLDHRRADLAQERECTLADIQFHGRAWVLPHPDRTNPGIVPMVRDDEVERIAVETVVAFERAQGWEVESVETDNRGFDLISRKPHPSDPKTAMAVRFIEVKGRAEVGEIALSRHEFDTAERLGQEYWLYVVYNCASTPQLHPINNPARLGWQPVRIVEQYRVSSQTILNSDGAPA